MAFDVRGAAEHELFSGANVSFNGSIDLRDSDINLGFRDLRAGADDERSVFGGNISREVAVDTEHRFEADFTRKIHDVAYKPEPIVFIYVGTIAIDEFRLAAFVSARNCLSSHYCLLSVFARWLRLGEWEAAGCRRRLNRDEVEIANKFTITLASQSGMLRLDCRCEASM